VAAERFDRRAVARGFAHPTSSHALRSALARTAETSDIARKSVPWADLRETAHAIKEYAIANLDRLLEQFEDQFTQRGGSILWASTADEAVECVIEMCRKHGATSVVKGKSMLSEEIGLNSRLASASIDAVETDLGEFIVQLAGQRPSHIVGPALHLSRQEIGKLFENKLGIHYSDDPQTLMSAARTRLRKRYLEAKIGITGVNFAIAETGTLIVVENEGNGGLSASVPPVHIALMGIEKIIPKLDDLQIFLRLLARAGTGQKLTTYTHYFFGPGDGRQTYCILVDAGRTKLLADPHTRQSLYCIRCGACLNVCPVYRRAGGWAYGGTYGGPIGAVITPALAGEREAKDLPFASSLCGACEDACPVGIDLAHQLVFLRHKLVEESRLRTSADRILDVWARAVFSLPRYRNAIKWLRRVAGFQRSTGLNVGPFGSWSQAHATPSIPKQSFKEWWERRR
jgi:L-lactate dehydrogenase complex protein LldF